jgi:hypothetical protein
MPLASLQPIDMNSDPTVVEDWKDDHQEDDTVHIQIVASRLFRLIWFPLRDADHRRTIRDVDDEKMPYIGTSTRMGESGDGCSNSSTT